MWGSGNTEGRGTLSSRQSSCLDVRGWAGAAVVSVTCCSSLFLFSAFLASVDVWSATEATWSKCVQSVFCGVNNCYIYITFLLHMHTHFIDCENAPV